MSAVAYKRAREVQVRFMPPSLSDAIALATAATIEGSTIAFAFENREAGRFTVDRAYSELRERTEVVVEGVLFA